MAQYLDASGLAHVWSKVKEHVTARIATLDSSTAAVQGKAIASIKEEDGIITAASLVDIPVVHDAALTIKINGENKGQFTADASVATTIDLGNFDASGAADDALAAAKTYTDDSIATEAAAREAGDASALAAAKAYADAIKVNGVSQSGQEITIDTGHIECAIADSSYNGKTVSVAIDDIDKRVAAAEAAGVKTFGGKNGAIAIEATGAADGSLAFIMDGSTLKGTVKGIENFAKKADELSATDTADGITVTLGGTVSAPTIAVSAGSGTVASGNTDVVTGGVVYNYIDASIKALDYTDDGDETGLVIATVDEVDGKIAVERKDASTLFHFWYDSDNRKIKLASKTNDVTGLVGEIDCDNFIKDGMLHDQVVVKATGASMTVTFPKGATHEYTGLTSGHQYIFLEFSNGEAAGTTYTYDKCDLNGLVDVYTAGDGLALANNQFSVDATVVRTSGAQTIAGVKTFDDGVVVDSISASDETASITLGDGDILFNADNEVYKGSATVGHEVATMNDIAEAALTPGQAINIDTENEISVKVAATGNDLKVVNNELKVDASTLVHTTGNETIAGGKTFTNGATFNGNVAVNSADVILDGGKLEADTITGIYPGNEKLTFDSNEAATLQGVDVYLKAVAGAQGSLAGKVYYGTKAADNEVATVGAVDAKIEALDVTDTAVAGKYVSAVSEADGKITVTRADLPQGTGSVTTTDWKKPISTVSLSDHTLSGNATTISIPAATASADGYMTKEYAAKLDGIDASATADSSIPTATIDSICV